MTKYLTALLLGICIPVTAYAHSGATGIIKQRMEAMKEIAAATKALASIVREQAPFDIGTITASAGTIRDHANTMGSLFPKGATNKPSEALPAIWDDRDEFIRLAKTLETLSIELTKAPVTKDKLGEQVKAIGQTCSGCHEKFRLKK